MKTFKRILLGLLLVIILFVVKTLYDAGTFKDINPHFYGTVKEIGGVIGVEDITIDQKTGFALLSSSERKVGKKSKRGDIFLLDLNKSDSKPINLTSNLQQDDFHPHGISLYTSTKGEKRLFVVNHRDNGNFIEVFQFTDSTLVLLESFSDDLFVSPNDVVGVGNREFYVTNDHNIPLSTKRTIYDYLQIGTGNIVYYDGYDAIIQDEDLKYANGINISKDKTQIFCGLSTGQAVNVYNRKSDGSLTFEEELKIGTGADNIEIDENGSLWIGCHPQLLKFTAHAANNTKLSPSQIVKIDYKSKGNFSMKEVYLNDGKPVSGSSVGAVWKDNLLVGTVFEPKILWCKMQN